MIVFEDEIKKFTPIKEVKETEDTIQDADLTDMVDILKQMTEEKQ